MIFNTIVKTAFRLHKNAFPRVSKVFWGQSKNEINFGGTPFQPVKLGANFRGLK